MSLGRTTAIVGLAVVAAIGYGLYAPGSVDRASPALGALAHRYHDQFWGVTHDAAQTPSQVRVASKAWRNVALYEPGQYIATLKYRNGSQTTLVNWTVRDIAPQQKAKSVIMFIGDGTTTNLITGRLRSLIRAL